MIEDALLLYLESINREKKSRKRRKKILPF